MAEQGGKSKKRGKNKEIKLKVTFYQLVLLASFIYCVQDKPSEDIDLLGEDAMANAYNICHSVQVMPIYLQNM